MLCLGALMVGVSKAGFGAGAGILAVPLIAVAVGAKEMLPILLPVLICGDIFALLHYSGRNDRDWRNLAVLVPSAVAGITVGMLVLDWFLKIPHGEEILQRTVGGICVVFASMQAYSYIRRVYGIGGRGAYRPSVWHGIAMGGVAGVTSTLAHSAGPLIALFLLAQQLPRRVFVGTCVFFFFTGNLIKLIPYTAEGLITGNTLAVSLVLFPATIGGTVLGSRLNKWLSEFYFNLAVYGITFATGVYLVV